MAANLTSYAAKQLLDYHLGALSLTRPTAWWVALHTANPTSAGTVAEIGAGLGYARQSITWAEAVLLTQDVVNTNILQFGPAIGAGFTVAYMTIYDASSGGNAWWYGSITGKVVVAGDSYTIVASAVRVNFPFLTPP